jgi:SAM-dependent methyltransferase
MKIASALNLFMAVAAGNTFLCNAFVVSPLSLSPSPSSPTKSRSISQLQMGLDLVTSLRTEWVSAAICTNQIPVTATSVLQLGTEDARAVTFVPRSVEELITSTSETSGELSVSCRRQLKQQRERRGTGAIIRYTDQRSDELSLTEDESIDVVISLQAADKMRENGLNWKNSVREAARVLKPGGRLIFVEQKEIEGDQYLDVLESVAYQNVDVGEDGVKEEATYPTFELIGVDTVDLVIVPHIAGVVMKTENAGLTSKQIATKKADDEKARIADLSISAFERGLKKRRKKKKKNQAEEETE